MDMRKLGLAGILAGALVGPATVSAITIDGITFEDGAIFETVILFEGERYDPNKDACDGTNTLCGNNNNVIDGVGEELIGVGKVTTIVSQTDNSLLWADGDNGRELTVYFYGYIAESVALGQTVDLVTGEILEVSVIRFSGGTIELRSDPLQNFDPTDQATGIATTSDGNLWLQLAGAPIVSGFGALTGQAITLTSTATTGEGGNPLADPGINVTGLGRLDVTGGATQEFFDTNTFGCLGNVATQSAPCPYDSDKTFTSSGQLYDTPQDPGGWGFFGTGEVKDVAQIPEPGTMALLGLGLVGLGFAARRRAKAA